MDMVPLEVIVMILVMMLVVPELVTVLVKVMHVSLEDEVDALTGPVLKGAEEVMGPDVELVNDCDGLALDTEDEIGEADEGLLDGEELDAGELGKSVTVTVM